MKIRIIRCPEGATQLERHPQRAGRLDVLRMRADETDAGSRHAGFFYVVTENAYDARAARSDGKEQDGVYPVFLKQSGDFTGGCG